MAEKKHVQVTLTADEYKLLRWYAYEMEMTVNRLLKEVTLAVAADYKKNG